MPMSYFLARDYLEQAVSILSDGDTQTQQLRHIVERTIALMSEVEKQARREEGNVLYFERYRSQPAVR